MEPWTDIDQKVNEEEEKRVGFCQLLFGPMFSRKSRNLDIILYHYKEKGFKVLKFIHSLDSTVINRKPGNNPFNNGIIPIYINELTIDTEIDDYINVIGIDEGQFFNENIIEFVKKHINLGKNIIICSLDGDSNQNLFGHIYKLIPFCNTFVKLTAICEKCLGEEHYKLAYFTQKKCETGELIEIGGKDLYDPVCRYHFNHK